MNRRKDDPKGMWDWFVLVVRDMSVALGAMLIAGCIGLVAGYLYGKHEVKLSQAIQQQMQPDCGSCRKGENK